MAIVNSVCKLCLIPLRLRCIIRLIQNWAKNTIFLRFVSITLGLRPCCHEILWLLSFGRSEGNLTIWNYDNMTETRKRHDCRCSSNARKTQLKRNSFCFCLTFKIIGNGFTIHIQIIKNQPTPSPNCILIKISDIHKDAKVVLPWDI